MFVARTKILTILIFCAISILLIFTYFKNGSLRVSTCEKCGKNFKEKLNIYKEDSKLLRKRNLQYDYIYERSEKSITAYDDESITSESDPESQNYKVLNNIEYIDFMNDSSQIVQKYSNIISLKQLLSVCIKAAKSGGAQLRSIRRNFDLKEIWNVKPVNSSDNPISVGRMRSHEAMTYTLKKYFPNIQLVSSKINGYRIEPYDGAYVPYKTPGDVLVPAKHILVWFEPLEPEFEYENNYLEYVTTMVCVAVKGKPVIGVIHQPFENFTKWGWVDHGVSHDVYPVASEPAEASRPISIVLTPDREARVKLAGRTVFGYQVNLIPVNGAGYKAIQLSEGRADAFLHMSKIKKWKACAPDALIRSLNGKMLSVAGKEIDYGNPSKFEDEGIIAVLQDYGIFSDFGRIYDIKFENFHN